MLLDSKGENRAVLSAEHQPGTWGQVLQWSSMLPTFMKQPAGYPLRSEPIAGRCRLTDHRHEHRRGHVCRGQLLENTTMERCCALLCSGGPSIACSRARCSLDWSLEPRRCHGGRLRRHPGSRSQFRASRRRDGTFDEVVTLGKHIRPQAARSGSVCRAAPPCPPPAGCHRETWFCSYMTP